MNLTTANVRIDRKALPKLDTDFGHRPTGNLDGRAVQIDWSASPRAQASNVVHGFFATMTRLAERMLNCVTPHEVRAHAKARAGLEQTSREVGELLGALSQTSHHDVDKPAAWRSILRLDGAMEPLVSRGAKADEVFKARVDFNLERMTNDELIALRSGMAIARHDKDAGAPQHPHFDVIDAAVRKTLGMRFKKAAFEKLEPMLRALTPAVALAGRGGGLSGVESIYKRAMSTAGKVFEQHGQKSEQVVERGLVMDVLAEMLERKQVQWAQVKDIFATLRTEELSAIASRLPTAANVPASTRAITSIARECLAERGLVERTTGVFTEAAAAKLGDRFNQAVTEFSKRRASLPASDLAQTVIDTAAHFEAYQTASKAALPANSQTDTSVKENRRAVEVELTMLLESGDIAMAELDDSQLRRLGSAFATLGVTPGCELIAAEIGTRYKRDVQAATAAMRNWNPSAVLKAVQSAQRKLDQIMQQQALAGRPAGNVNQLRNDLMNEAMAGLSLGELRALGKVMDDVNATKLTAAMAESGLALMPEHPALGKEIVELTYGVGAMRAAVARAHKAIDPDAPDAKPYGTFTLSTAMGGVGVAPALREVFGIEVGTRENVNVTLGVATDFVQDSVTMSLRNIVGEPSTAHSLTDGRSAGVSKVLWQALGRANYTVLDSQGTSVPLMVGSADRDSDDARLDAVHHLRNIAGNNPKLLMALSTVANPDAMIGIVEAMRSQHSPIRLPDGTPGELLGRSESSFTIRGDGKGGLRVVCSYSISDATHLSVVGAEGAVKPIGLREGAYANFTFEVAISPDGILAAIPLTEPLRVEYEAKPDLWTKDYKKPSHVSEILAQDKHSPMRADFRDSVKKHYQAESLAFYEELEAFSPKSDEEARELAQKLVEKYIRPDADMQVNIASGVAGAITAAMLKAEDMNAQQLRDLFAPAQIESLTLMQTNNLKLFVKDHTAAE